MGLLKGDTRSLDNGSFGGTVGCSEVFSGLGLAQGLLCSSFLGLLWSFGKGL